MKISKATLIFVMLTCLGVLCESGCSPPKMTKSQIMEMFDKAGGVEKVNAEAKVVFEIFSTNEVYVLQDYHVPHLQDYPEIKSHPEITNFPAIFALGDVVMVQRGLPPSVPEIYIRFGVHRRAKVIHILPPNLDATNFGNASAFTNESLYIRVAPNIFVDK